VNSRQRLLASLTGDPPDRVPWEPLVDEYFLSSLPEAFQRQHLGSFSPDKDDETITPDPRARHSRFRRAADFARLIGADVFGIHAPGLTCRVDDLITEEVRRGQKVVRRWITSAGVISDTISRVPESAAYPFYGEEYRVKTAEDLRVYRHIWENTSYELDAGAFLDAEAYIGDDGIAVIDGPQSAVQLLLGEISGVMSFYHLLQDHPVEMETLIETMHSRMRAAYEILARSPSHVITAMEDLSSTTSSPRIFRRFSWRHLNEYADILHARGKVFLAHMCGRLKAMAPLIAQSKLDGVESLTSPPIGDLSITDARALWGERLVIVGGLNAGLMLETDQDRVREAVLAALRQAAPGRNFVLSNADAMPSGANLDTLRTITEVVRECGSFPLRDL